MTVLLSTHVGVSLRVSLLGFWPFLSWCFLWSISESCLGSVCSVLMWLLATLDEPWRGLLGYPGSHWKTSEKPKEEESQSDCFQKSKANVAVDCVSCESNAPLQRGNTQPQCPGCQGQADFRDSTLHGGKGFSWVPASEVQVGCQSWGSWWGRKTCHLLESGLCRVMVDDGGHHGDWLFCAQGIFEG